MTNNQHGQVPASSAVLKAIREASMQLVHTGDDDAYMLLPYLQAHVQNPAEIEHVAGDVSKNGAEVNMAYAELPTRYYLVGGVEKAWDHQQMRDFADATHALRASQGQASSQAGEYPALVCDYCGALTPDPWHSSGMLHGKMSKHIHSCDACAARGAAQAQAAKQQEQLI